jgi:hypothetical protein
MGDSTSATDADKVAQRRLVGAFEKSVEKRVRDRSGKGTRSAFTSRSQSRLNGRSLRKIMDIVHAILFVRHPRYYE